MDRASSRCDKKIKPHRQHSDCIHFRQRWSRRSWSTQRPTAWWQAGNVGGRNSRLHCRFLAGKNHHWNSHQSPLTDDGFLSHSCRNRRSPIKHPIDGRSFFPILLGKKFTETRPAQVWMRPRRRTQIRWLTLSRPFASVTGNCCATPPSRLPDV